LGAVWPRANTPLGPISRAPARKLSVVMSFVALAMLHSTFLVLIGCTNITSAALLYSPQGYHDTCELVKQPSLRLLADVSGCSPRFAAFRAYSAPIRQTPKLGAIDVGMPRRHPASSSRLGSDMPSAYYSLNRCRLFTPNTVVITVQTMRIGRQHRKIVTADVRAVQIWRWWWNTEIRVRWIARTCVLRRAWRPCWCAGWGSSWCACQCAGCGGDRPRCGCSRRRVGGCRCCSRYAWLGCCRARRGDRRRAKPGRLGRAGCAIPTLDQWHIHARLSSTVIGCPHKAKRGNQGDRCCSKGKRRSAAHGETFLVFGSGLGMPYSIMRRRGCIEGKRMPWC
jgi:hypothetical protein